MALQTDTKARHNFRVIANVIKLLHIHNLIRKSDKPHTGLGVSSDQLRRIE